MANLQVINIVIKAYLPTGKTLDEQYEALTKVKEAHKSGDYSELLKVATIEEVKTEQKTRRFEDAPQTQPQADGTNAHGIGPDTDGGANPDYQPTEPTDTVDAPMASDDWSKPLTEDEKAKEQAATTRRRTRGE